MGNGYYTTAKQDQRKTLEERQAETNRFFQIRRDQNDKLRGKRILESREAA